MLGSTLNSSVARTTIVAESALAPEEATICAVPGATADTMPEVLTLAIAAYVFSWMRLADRATRDTGRA